MAILLTVLFISIRFVAYWFLFDAGSSFWLLLLVEATVSVRWINR